MYDEEKFYKELWCDGEGNLRLHYGVGGGGKTYSILNDPGWQKVIYAAPSHKLRREKQEQFPKIKTEVHYNMLNYPRRTEYEYGSERKDIYVPSVILFDEGLTKYSLEQARDIYPHAVIIILQDVNVEKSFCYQLPNLGSDGKEAAEIDWSDFVKIEYVKNRRAKDEKLKELLKWYRTFTDKSVSKSVWSNDKVKELKETIKEKLKDRIIEREDVKKKYKLHDYVLVGRRVDRKQENIRKLRVEIAGNYYNKDYGLKLQLKKLEKSNYKPGVIYWTEQLKETGLKYLVVNNDSKKYINGEVLYPDEKIKMKCVEERHAFTCHQIQGETIKSPIKVFIDLDDLFSVFQMLYVALSRVEYLSQIYIII